MAPLQPDPYNILGVPTDADTSEIRASYRKLVLKCHPDKVQDPTLKAEKHNEFQRVQQAYELLTDDDERRKYDMKVKLDALRCQMKEREKARKASPKPAAKFSAEFEIRTPEMRPSGFKSPSPATKIYTSGVRYDDEYATRTTRVFETKGSRSSKRDPSVSERYSKREAAEREREREKDSQRDRERRRKEEEVSRRKAEKEAQKLDKKRQDKNRDRDLKRDAEEKHRARYANPKVEVYEEEVLKSERKRSSKKHDEKGGRTSPPEKPIPRPPVSGRSFYTPTDRNKFENASSYVQASRGAPSLSRSYSYSSPPVYPAAPSPPPTNPKKAFMVEESDSDDYVRRSSAPSRRGSGEPPRLSRERSAYRKSSNEVLDDNLHASPSPAARASFSRPMGMGSTPPRHEMPLPRVNSLPQQPGFSRASPGMTRAHTFAAPEMPRGRDRSRTQPQAHFESSDEEHEHDRRYRSRRTASPEPQRDVWCYNVDPETRRTRRVPHDMDSGHAHYMHAHPVRVVESRVPPVYREGSYPGPPPSRYPNVATSKYGEVRYSDYPPYSTPVRA